MFKKLAVWLIMHSRSTGWSTGFQNLLTIGRPRSTARSTVPNRKLGAVSRSTARSPDMGSGRPDNVHTCTHPTVRTAIDRSVDRSDLKQSRSTVWSTAIGQNRYLGKKFLKICIFSKKIFVKTL